MEEESLGFPGRYIQAHAIYCAHGACHREVRQSSGFPPVFSSGQYQCVVCIANNTTAEGEGGVQHLVICKVSQRGAQYGPLWNPAVHPLSALESDVIPVLQFPVSEMTPLDLHEVRG